MGRSDEQYPTLSRGDRAEGADLHLNDLITVAEIDAVLMRGSGFVDGMLRIYEQFQKHLPSAENAAFLAKEYGMGGWSEEVVEPYSLSIACNGKGISIIRRLNFTEGTKLNLSWKQVGERIQALISDERYLSEKQLAEYPIYLSRQEARRQRAVIANEFKDIFFAYNQSIYDKEIDAEPLNNYVLSDCASMYMIGRNQTGALHHMGDDILPMMHEALDEIIEHSPTLADRCRELRRKLPAVTETVTPDLLPSPEQQIEIIESIHDPIFSQFTGADYRITNDELGAGTPSVRFRNNVAAIRLLKTLERENRPATPDEQNVLAQYVGWGGLDACFDQRHTGYSELKALLTDNEYAAAKDSTLTAFYTPPTVIRAVYAGLREVGFEGGKILEPSCGIGHFIGLRPENLAATFTAVELDSISGRIAKQLYPSASVSVQGFETTKFADNSFDAVIGNIPFGDFGVSDRKYNHLHYLIHDYFFAKALDQVKPGGIVAFITSKGTLDKKDDAVRKYIAERAELLGAIRLPDNTFRRAAGTEVVSDIIFLQKRSEPSTELPAWVSIGETDMGHSINRYFIDHPEMILGELKEKSGRFGPELTVTAREDRTLEEQLSEAIKHLQASTPTDIDDLIAEEYAPFSEPITAPSDIRSFSYFIGENNQIYYKSDDSIKLIEGSEKLLERIKGMIGIRDAAREVISLQRENASDEAIAEAQMTLNVRYDQYTLKYGVLSSRENRNAFHDDNSAPLLTSLETLDDKGRLKEKAALFSRRTIKPHIPITHVDTPEEALTLSMSEKGGVDLGYMASLTDRSEEELESALEGLIFRDIRCPIDSAMISDDSLDLSRYPLVSADEYLSGNVREKLRMAEAMYEALPLDQKYRAESNLTALTEVQPVDLTADEISVKLGATWVPPKYFKDFMFELLSLPGYLRYRVDVEYSPHTASFKITGANRITGIKATETYGTHRVSAPELIEDCLNQKHHKVNDAYIDSDGKRRYVVNQRETVLAMAKQDAIKEAFANWIWQDERRKTELCKLYNEQFNSIRPRTFDGSHLTFDGINSEITLRPHQLNAIARILYGGNTLLAHVVGAGKTFEMIAAAMESKRLGLCTKSMFVVPNHLTQQMGSDFLRLYPAASILVATDKDFEADRRKLFCARIATGDYDAVIIGHSQFEKIPMSIEKQRAMIEQEIEEITDALAEERDNRGNSFSVKSLAQKEKQLRKKLEDLTNRDKKDDVINFEELGIDRIFVDEAHEFKNLPFVTKMTNVAGISTSAAQKATDLYLKCRWLDEVTDGKGIVFATGTPISNSVAEMYTMQRYLGYGELKEKNITMFDAWASTFGETVIQNELSPDGNGFRPRTRFAKFHNIPELRAMFAQFADVQTADMLNLPVPKVLYHTEEIAPTAFQKEIIKSFAKRADRIHAGNFNPHEDNMLKITDDGRKLALDQRLFDPLLPDAPTSKVNRCAQKVFEIWQETADQRLTQIVFCDLSTPKDEGFSVYVELKQKLIAKGIPAEEIAFIHDAKNKEEQEKLFKKVQRGDVRVFIGSTAKMGTGTNVQDLLIALHHLDAPKYCRPSDVEQREGRIIRQGNRNETVHIYRYITAETFDAYMYQILENKQRFISQIMTSKSPARVGSDVDEAALSYAEIKALALGDPAIKERVDLENEVNRLKVLKQQWVYDRRGLEASLKHFPEQEAQIKERIARYEADVATAKEHPLREDVFEMVVGGITYTDRAEAAKALHEAVTSDEPNGVLGSYRGFALSAHYETILELRPKLMLTFMGKLPHRIELGESPTGNMTRLDNAIENLPAGLNDNKLRLVELQHEKKVAELEVKKPFEKEGELTEKTRRLEELQKSFESGNELTVDAGEDVDSDMMPTQLFPSLTL